MSDFRGARGSNTGDDYHELWATRHAIRLLDERDPLQALALEGLARADEASASDATWDGVDCTLYEGGRNAAEADRVIVEQLKYSAANPAAAWTAARLAQGKKREESVVNKLARAWSGIRALGPRGPVEVALVTNQPIASALETAATTIAAGGVAIPRSSPGKGASDEARLAYAAGLSKADLPAFAGALRLRGSSGSRFAIEEQVLAAMAGWADLELQQVVADLRRFIRHRMRPEFAGELITRESVLLGLGVASIGALFPCRPFLAPITRPVPRESVTKAARRIVAGERHFCLHGSGGIGKTTALQEIEAALPSNSVMIVFDCYGGGRYLDAGALRHRPIDAFLQLSNELATRLRLPILLGRHHASDTARLFANRLRHAAGAHAAQYPNALIVIAVDAADNAVTAAAARRPPEPCFVHDFVGMSDLPDNVRFIVTARTGRLPEIALPPRFEVAEISPFTPAETAEHVQRTWNAPPEWLEAFQSLTAGVPRVQAYAMDLGSEAPEKAIDRLLPGGRSLDQVFREQFERALAKSGTPSDVARLCAGLIALARPVPLADLAGVLGIAVPVLVDICTDMAPAIRLEGQRVSFADEDFEHFVREEGASALGAVTQNAAEWLLARCKTDPYAAQNVSGALAAAGRGADLLELVEREPVPEIVADPVQRREAELIRLRLAISVCRKAGDPARALRFVLIGGEGLRTERALRALLRDNPDLAVRFAPLTAGRLILSDPEQIGAHGAFLLHKRAVDAAAGDRVSLRESGRLIEAWMRARADAIAQRKASGWRLEIVDIAAACEAALRAGGPEYALDLLSRWRPRRLRLEVARLLVPRLLAEGRADLLQSVIDTGQLRSWEEIFLLVPMAISGLAVDAGRLAAGLARLTGRLNLRTVFNSGAYAGPGLSSVLDTVMCACELLARDVQADPLVDALLADILRPANRSIAIHSPTDAGRLDLLFRAHALNAARAGRAPATTDLYEPRPEPPESEQRRGNAYREEEADRRLMEATRSVFDIYSARAMALAGRAQPQEAVEQLERFAEGHDKEHWRLAGSRGAAGLAMAAARSLLVLLATGIDAQVLASLARRTHRQWGAEVAPDEAFAARMALSPALHAMLVADVDRAAQAIKVRRMGAEEKSGLLVAYARLLLPVSPDDANAIFHEAVEAASQLDREIIHQLRLLGSLFERGMDHVGDRRAGARDLSEVMADAAIRLEHYDDLPWGEVMETLATLDLPLALANAARWDDAGLAQLRQTLAPVLKTGLLRGRLSPAAAAALDLLLDGDHQVVEAALDIAARGGAIPAAMLEEAAWDSLIRHDHRSDEKLASRIDAIGAPGRWAAALVDRQAFVSDLMSKRSAHTPQRAQGHRLAKGAAGPVKPDWTRDVLLNAEELGRVVREALDAARAAGQFVSASEVFGWAADAVAMKDRAAFLSTLAAAKAGKGGEIAEKLLDLIDRWNSPAIRSWASTALPDTVVARFPEFVRYIDYGDSALPRALDQAQLSSGQAVDLVLRGVELHGQALGGEQVFALAGLVSEYLEAAAAADLGLWYSGRLAGRIAPEHRDQLWQLGEVPDAAPVAAARFLYSCMGDFDVRVRWRAAHAVRRLARLGATEELEALVGEYGRWEETVFRSPKLDFYWIAARLWFVIAFDRIAGEAPAVGQLAGPALMKIALDEDFPHVLVRCFARDACLKLAEAGQLALGAADRALLEAVGRSKLPPQEASEDRPRGRRPYPSDTGLHFQFDPMDSIPYWYDPVLDAFADLSQEELLQAAERWIMDRWGYPGEIRAYDAEPRRHHFSDRNWALTSNRHGANPTLERLNHHLEWHALWCAVGELLRTEPLVAATELDWDKLPQKIAREMLSEPPLWAADLRTATPLRPDFWRDPELPVPEWTEDVVEGRMRGEIEAADRPGYLVVDGGWEIRSHDRLETVSLSSALVEPAVAAALLRALQTMESAWDYQLPYEDKHDLEREDPPYRMVGWLRTTSSDGGIDQQDPLRGPVSIVGSRPGTRVREACGLVRAPGGAPVWAVPGQEPMFLYQAWGEREQDDERYAPGIRIAGRRLLAARDQLAEFLRGEELDLVIEVEVRREGRGNRRSYDSEDDTPEARYDRIYRIERTGDVHAAEGCVGTWTGNRPPA